MTNKEARYGKEKGVAAVFDRDHGWCFKQRIILYAVLTYFY